MTGGVIIDMAINMRAKRLGSTIHPAHLAAIMMRRRSCWSRGLGRGSDGEGGTSPCHSHRPASLASVLINVAEGDIGAFPVTIGALPDAWPINSPGSACMAHNPPLVAALIFRGHSVRRPGRAQTASGSQPPKLSA